MDERPLTEARKIRLEKWRRYAQTHLLGFIEWCWQLNPKKRPFVIGRHTRAICNRIDQAIEAYLTRGETTYLNINVPFRHGKSEIVSRFLPAFFLGRCAEQDPGIILSGYSTSLCKGFSKKVQAIVRSEQYRQLFPTIEIKEDHRAAEEWSVVGSQGVVVAQGLEGSITGKGGNLIIVDDYCKDRADAESPTMRDNMWEAFTDVVMSRLNGCGLVIVCATRWHIDDIVGRIKDGMKKDPCFPRFEDLVFPATKKGKGGWDYLCTDMYKPSWYDAQRATLGSYSAAALLDCEPVGDAMRVFKESWLCFYTNPPARENMNVYTFVDSANSKKENADYTTMVTIGYAQDQNFYLLDLVHDRMNLKERTDAIFEINRKFRPIVTFWEQIGAMADISHIQLEQDRLGWHFSIHPLNHRVAKDTRIRSLQPHFENARIWLPRTMAKLCADGNVRDTIREMIDDEYLVFPGCKHDDILDPLADICDQEVIAATSFPREEIDDGSGGVYQANTTWRR